MAVCSKQQQAFLRATPRVQHCPAHFQLRGWAADSQHSPQRCLMRTRVTKATEGRVSVRPDLLDVENPAPISPIKPGAPDAEEPSPSTPPAKDYSGYLALAAVAALWGSYTPALRFLYLTDSPPDAPLLNSLQACLSAAFLISATLFSSLRKTREDPHYESLNPLLAEDQAMVDATRRRDADARAIRKQTEAIADWQRRPPTNPVEKWLTRALNWRSNDLLIAGGEVGLWMTLAFSLEVAGVQLCSATKAAFLNQVSVLITPVLVHLSGARVRPLEWTACGLGLGGSLLVAADSILKGAGEAVEGAHGAVAGQGTEMLGLVFVVVSAMFFALTTVRLGRYSSEFDSLKLSTTSMTALGALSLVWLGASSFGHPEVAASQLASLMALASSPACVLTLLWVGFGPGALAAFLQTLGQKSVPPAQSQVIYSTTPLWAAGFAVLVLDASGEAMGGIAWAGAAVMLAASIMTALLPPESTDVLTSLDADE